VALAHYNYTDALRLVPLLTVLSFDRSSYVLTAYLPKPDALPSVHADFGPYLSFDLNYAAIWAITTELYYLILTPGVAVSHSLTGYTHIRATREASLIRFDRSYAFEFG
jgi:hypothetical protein